MNFGVVGHGFMGSRHVKTINGMECLKCVAVCDIDPLRLSLLDINIRRYADIDSLLADDEIDAVVIATPNKYHRDHAIKAARAGKHIICEKPVAMSVKDFDEILRASEDNHVILTSHLQRRFDKDFQTIKCAYERGLVGDPYLVKSMMFGYNGNMHDWHVHISEGGGMLFDWGVHLVDQILYMIDSPLKSIYADVRNIINYEVDDYYKIILRFENWVTAEIELGTYMLSDKPGWFPRHWHMFGNMGSMYVDNFEPEGKIVRTTGLLTDVTDTEGRYCGPTRSFGFPDEGLIITEDIPFVSTDATDYYRNFVSTMEGDEDILVKPREMRRVLSVIEAVWESARTMQSVAFE